MTTYKSFNDLVLDILDYLRLTQPNLDVKPNSVARDLFVDAPSLQMASLYDALREVAAMQSISNITGQDLTNYGANYGLTRQSEKILWLEFNEDGTFKSKHDEPAVGRSLLMSPFSMFFAWQTTEITEILEQTEDYLKFKTLNSTYELWKLS